MRITTQTHRNLPAVTISKISHAYTDNRFLILVSENSISDKECVEVIHSVTQFSFTDFSST